MRAADGWDPRPATSVEYVWTAITAEDNTGASANPTSNDGYLLFQPEATLTSPTDDDSRWAAGTWRTLTHDHLGNELDAPEYQLGALVGSGADIDPGAGHHNGYVKIVADPETLIREVENTTLILD